MADVARLTIDVRTNSSSALAGLARLDAAVRRASSSIMQQDRSTRRATQSTTRHSTAMNSLTRHANQVTQAFSGSAGGMGHWTRIIVASAAAATALFPVLQGGIAVMGGLTSAFSIAGIALGVYGLAVKGALGGQKEIKKKMAETTAAFNKQTKAIVQPQINTFFSAMSSALIKMVPLVRAVAPVAQSVANAFKNWVGTKLDVWVKFIATAAVPILRSMVRIGKDLITTFGALVVQFQPFGTSIVMWLKKGADQLARWASGGGFAAFMANVKANGPNIKLFFQELGGALKTLLQTMNALGPVGLGLTTTLLKLAGAMNPKFLAALIAGFVAYKTALFAVRAANTILAISNAVLGTSFTLISGPIGLIIAAVAAIAVGIIFLATKTRFFQTVWGAVWGAVKAAFWATWNFIKRNWPLIVGILLGPIAIVAAVMYKNWASIRNAIVSAWRSIYNNAIAPMIRFFTGAVPSAARAVWHALATAWNAAKNAVVSAVTNMRDRVLNVFGSLKNRVMSWANGAKNWLVSAGKNLILGLFHGAEDAMKSVGSWVKKWGSKIINGVKSFFGIHSPSRVFHGLGGHMIQGMMNGIINNGGSIKDLIQKSLGISGNPMTWLVDHFDSVGMQILGKVPELATAIAKSAPKLLGKLMKMGGGIAKKLGSFFSKMFGGGTATIGTSHGALLAQAMGIAGVPSSWAGPLNTLISRESGWNPNAINLTDSNAKAGHPSRGLMQTIPSTFAAYRNKSLSGSITDPLANIVAGINYIKSRYGSVFNVQQAVGSTPKGYATGGLASGLSLVGERGPELINAGSGSRVFTNKQSVGMLRGSGGDVYHVTVNLNGTNMAGSREVEDAVVRAITTARRKGRNI